MITTFLISKWKARCRWLTKIRNRYVIHEDQIVIFAKSEKMNTTRYVYFFAKIAKIGEKDKQSTCGLKIRIFISWIYIWGKRFLTIMIFANGNAKKAKCWQVYSKCVCFSSEMIQGQKPPTKYMSSNWKVNIIRKSSSR